MMSRTVGLVVLLVLLALPAAAGVGTAYTPKAGDDFHYYETVVLNDGTGVDYTGYTENTWVNGSVSVNSVLPNGTVNASYQNSDHWINNSGFYEAWTSSGSFDFSASTWEYVSGTDNQTGYAAPIYLWFLIDNGLPVDAGLYLLNSPMNVVSRNYSYDDLSESRYVATIFTEGNGTYVRDDVYGIFDASYNWKSYFDPSTGYIVGYLYTEHDTNSSSGDGFTWTDTLAVTSTSYPLTSAAAPASSSSSPLSTTLVTVIAVVVILVIVIAVVAWLVSRSRRSRPAPLPRHAAPGTIGYGAPPPPPAYAPMGGAPPIHLTPSNQPVPQVVLRETVKVKCRYCGTLIDVTDKVCPNCGAPVG
jgi:hypothetical protein